jgi:hypothetical protein
MSYYILPKINTELILDPCVHLSMDKITPYISQSLVNYLTKATISLNNLLTFDTTYTFKFLNQLINPYEYLFSNVPNSNLSICKIKPSSKIYYDILEIYNTLKLSECLPEKNMISLYYGSNGSGVLEYIQSFRDNYDDTNIVIEPILHKQNNTTLNSGINMQDDQSYTPIPDNILAMCDYMYIELPDKVYLDTNKYILGLLKAVKFILMYQSLQGCIILKLGHTYYKPVIDILYIISSLYNKAYIIKPNTSNNIYDEKYLVCKTFTCTSQKRCAYLDKIDKMYTICYREQHEINIQSIVKNEINMYFLNKMEECNIIIGQQQIDVYDQMINLVKNKNKLEKIETTRKHNIQKCINWCEKYKLPCNKFADKINIFLPITAHDTQSVKNSEDTSGCWIENDENESNGYKSENSDDMQSYISNNNIDDEVLFDNCIINKDLLHEIEYGVE